LYKPSVDELYKNLDSYIVPEIKDRVEKDYREYESLGLHSSLARRLARLEVVASSPDIIQIASESKVHIVEIAGLYFAVGARFGFTRLRSMANMLVSNNTWHRLAVNAMTEDLFIYQGWLTKEIYDYIAVNHEKPFIKTMDAVEFWIEDHRQHVMVLDQLLTDVGTSGAPDLALLTVVQRELRLMCE
jgi:glutamate dehydrogenase